MSPSGYLRQKISSASSRPLLPSIARARLQSIRAKRPASYTERLIDFIPRVTRGFERPDPFAAYLEEIERASREPIRCAFAAPPQHGKSECSIHGLVWTLIKTPGRRHAYATYQQMRARRVANKARLVAERAGLQVGGTQDYWILPDGGTVIWTSVGGALTGEPIDGLLLIDDPFKDRREADSEVIRQHRSDWYDDVADTRLHKTASVLEMATRWHPGDLTGYLIANHGFPYLNLKAIADGDCPAGDNRQPGEALWESRKSLADLELKRTRNPFSFASLYQGEPRPRGGKVFNEPARYDPESLPARGYRVAYGVDLAYTSKTSADWSVCIELWEHEGYVYVVGLDRHQVDAPSFTLTLKAAHANRRAGFFWYASGTEKGSAQFIQNKGIPLNVLDPEGRDKYTRAIACAEAWNAGKVLVPDADDDWVHTFVDEVCNFTGIKDANDDQVDALVAGFDGLPQTTVITPTSGPSGGGRWGGSPGRGFG
jgi:predicted phage terminase large subunit-like protein